MYVQPIKTNFQFDVSSIGIDNLVYTQNIPSYVWESLQFGHNITMKLYFVTDNDRTRHLLFCKSSEIRDVSHSKDGFIYLATDDNKNSPEYRLSRLPNEIKFKIRDLINVDGLHTSWTIASIWLEFCFYPISTVQSDSFVKRIINDF